MAFDKRYFTTGRGSYNNVASPNVITVHMANILADTVEDAKVTGYFDSVAEDLIAGDLILVTNPSDNPVYLSVNQATAPVEVQELQIPRIAGIIQTSGGSPVELFLADIPPGSIVQAQVVASGVAGIYVERCEVVSGQAQVTFSADPSTTTSVSLVVYAPIIPPVG